MKRFIPIAVASLLSAFALGCGSDDSGTPTISDPNPDGLLVEYVRTGGFAPNLQQLTIQVDGDAELLSGYEPDPPKRQQFELSATELADLEAAVEAADLGAVETGDGVCADCFYYEISTADAKVELSDADLFEGSTSSVPNEVLELLDQLAAVLDEHAKETPMTGG